ncbi:TIP-1 family-domain-containing protein [Dipodascopsis tothii]|uniref:TIP-1 family-domain-containing protein n=1 Tax=Dipodascopsis tothii TaxID=44089 RepID=UPI0034CE5BB4
MATVTEYINATVGGVDGLDKLDALIASLDQEQLQISREIASAEERIEAERQQLVANTARITDKISEFKTEHAVLKDNVAEAEATFAQADFVGPLETLLAELARYEAARDYFTIVRDVLTVCDEAEAKVLEDTTGALADYDALAAVEAKVGELAGAAGLRLVEFVAAARARLWQAMKATLYRDLRSELADIGWPRAVRTQKQSPAFDRSFERLLAFQFGGRARGPADEAVYAFEVLALDLDVRFRFHFETPRETNRADKPEWFFTHFVGALEDHQGFLEAYVQQLLDDSTVVQRREAVHELITAFLPSVRRKLEELIPAVLHDPQLLSHLMLESMKFDDGLREAYLYAPFGADTWHGVTGDMVAHVDWFEAWLSVEKEFALGRYQTIVSADDAWTIEAEGIDAAETNPTRSAVRLKDLLETITQLYRPLHSFAHQLRFLTDIQIAILDSYHEKLSLSLDAFETLTSSIMRAVSGVSAAREDERRRTVGGVAGVERLCRVLCSGVHVHDALRDWGEDILFLELHSELNERVARNRGVIPDTDKALGIADKLPATVAEDGTMFDEIIAAYSRLNARAEGLIVRHLQREVQRAYKADPSARDLRSKEAMLEVAKTSDDVKEILLFLSATLSPPLFKRVTLTVDRSFQN